jgi:hypothetical protein
MGIEVAQGGQVAKAAVAGQVAKRLISLFVIELVGHDILRV